MREASRKLGSQIMFVHQANSDALSNVECIHFGAIQHWWIEVNSHNRIAYDAWHEMHKFPMVVHYH